MPESPVQFTVNGQLRTLWVSDQTTLLEVLRHRLGLSGTKDGCAVGQCGACTVWIDGAPRLACLTLARSVADRQILTIEGLAEWARRKEAADSETLELHPLQRTFVEAGGVQCGFCTPGMIMAGAALLRDRPLPSKEEIREAISGHLCRCTGYEQIVRAIETAAASEGEGRVHHAS